MREYAQREPHGHERRVELRFLRSPVEILGEGEDGPVTGIRDRQEPRSRTAARSPTGEEEVIACGLVIRSIGYRGAPLAGIPFDERRGPDLQPRRPRARRRAASTRSASTSSAGSSAARPASSAPTRRTRPTPSPGSSRTARPASSTRPRTPTRDACEQFLAEQCPDLVTWEGWRAIDEHETGLGEPQGRPRVKLVRTGEMIDIASGAAALAATAAARRGRAAGPRRG